MKKIFSYIEILLFVILFLNFVQVFHFLDETQSFVIPMFLFSFLISIFISFSKDESFRTGEGKYLKAISRVILGSSLGIIFMWFTVYCFDAGFHSGSKICKLVGLG